jgi:hypothetical protein
MQKRIPAQHAFTLRGMAVLVLAAASLLSAPV